MVCAATARAQSPSVTSVEKPVTGLYKAGDGLAFTVYFSEPVTVNTAGGVPYLELLVGSQTRRAVYSGGSGTRALSFSYRIVAGDVDADGVTLGALLERNGGTIQDVDGNNADVVLVNLNSQIPYVDAVLPKVTAVAVPAPGYYKTGDALEFTVNFDENVISSVVTGRAYIPVNIGTTTVKANLNRQTARSLTFLYRIVSGDRTLTGISIGNAIVLNGTDIRDVAGNPATTDLRNVGNTSGINVLSTRPVVTHVTVPLNGTYKTGEPLVFTVHLSEAVRLTRSPARVTLPVMIGSTPVQAAYVSGDGSDALVFRYVVRSGQMDTDGIYIGAPLQLNGDILADPAGNTIIADLHNIAPTSSVFVNTGTPAVTLSASAPALVNAPFTIRLTFTEPVTGLDVTEISAVNAAVTNLQTADNVTYTALVTPAMDGPVNISLPAGMAVNPANTGNTASNTLTFTYDKTAPQVAAVGVPAPGFYKTGDVLDFTVTFDENIVVNTAGGQAYIDVTIGSDLVKAAFFRQTTNTVTFRYTVVDGNRSLNGINLGSAIVANGMTILDMAGNYAVPGLKNIGNTGAVNVLTTPPSLKITGAITQNSPWTAILTFSDPVTGFDVTDIGGTNVTFSNFQPVNDSTFSVLVTPAADGPVQVKVPGNVAFNGAGYGNPPVSISYQYDATPPVVTAVTVPPNGTYKTGDALDFTVRLSERVRLLRTPVHVTLPVMIGSSQVEAAYVGGDQSDTLAFRYIVKNGEMDLNGIGLGTALMLNGDVLIDYFRNPLAPVLNNVAATGGVFINTGVPRVTLSTSAAAVINTPFTISLIFTEPVTGLEAGELHVVNATVTNLQTTDNVTYTALVTPAGDGPVSISLPAGMAVNPANTGNTASNTLTVTYDKTPPQIAAGQHFNVLQTGAVGSVVGTVQATPAPLLNWSIAADGAAGAFSIDAAGVVKVLNTAALNRLTGNTTTLGITVSDGLNTSGVVPVTITVLLVNKAPVLDPVANTTICATVEAHRVQLTGASAVEAGQTYTITAAADQPFFDLLTVDAAGVLHYKLKPDVSDGRVAVTVTIQDNGGTANGGADLLRRTFTVNVSSLPVITISSDKGAIVAKGELVRLTAAAGGNNTFKWDETAGVIGGVVTPVLQVRPVADAAYKVTVTNSDGCTNTATFGLKVAGMINITANNILTPNGDGFNDRWVVKDLHLFPDNELKIFDRAGRMVYVRWNYSNDWDGKVNGQPLAEGTYYYVLTINQGETTLKGFITIVH
nr:gliding motility-associated C-terminal domain-containing protein [uncultured Chitinophaga sp.]